MDDFHLYLNKLTSDYYSKLMNAQDETEKFYYTNLLEELNVITSRYIKHLYSDDVA